MTDNNPSLLIADDHPILLDGLADHLYKHGYRVVGKATDGAETMRLITELAPDVAIVDIEMPVMSGLEIAQLCKSRGLPTRIIILTAHKEHQLITQSRMLGISGYVLKEDASAEILECLEQVLQGGEYYSNRLTASRESSDRQLHQFQNLSPSERKILKLVSENRSTQEIAELLHVSERTIEKHRSNIIGKLSLDGQANALTNWAIENRKLISHL